MGGDHHVRRAVELDNHLDEQIGSGRRRSEEHHGLDPTSIFRYRGARSLEAAAMSSPSLATGGGDEEDADAGDGDEGGSEWKA